jgi:phage gp37-like protein
MLAQIENAIIAHIKLASTAPALGYKLAAVASYGGEFDGDLGQVIRSFPAVWVTFAGASKPVPYSTAKDKWLVACTFAVMCGARNVRSEAAARQGSVGMPGAYQILENTQTMLLMQDFGLAISPLEPGNIKTLYNSQLNNEAIAIFAQEWHTKFVVQAPIGAGGIFAPINAADPNWPTVLPPDFLRLQMDYYLKPGHLTPDASDTKTL